MKYEFIKVDEDITKLKYKDKEFDIKKDIDLLSKLESIQQRAKIKMMKDLAKDGLTVKDFEVERVEGNKKIIDKSNLIDMEKGYLDIVAMEILNEISNKYFSMTLLELTEDIGLGEDDTQNFTYDLLFAIKGEKSPRVKKQPDVL